MFAPVTRSMRCPANKTGHARVAAIQSIIDSTSRGEKDAMRGEPGRKYGRCQSDVANCE